MGCETCSEEPLHLDSLDLCDPFHRHQLTESLHFAKSADKPRAINGQRINGTMDDSSSRSHFLHLASSTTPMRVRCLPQGVVPSHQANHQLHSVPSQTQQLPSASPVVWPWWLAQGPLTSVVSAPFLANLSEISFTIWFQWPHLNQPWGGPRSHECFDSTPNYYLQIHLLRQYKVSWSGGKNVHGASWGT